MLLLVSCKGEFPHRVLVEFLEVEEVFVVFGRDLDVVGPIAGWERERGTGGWDCEVREEAFVGLVVL